MAEMPREPCHRLHRALWLDELQPGAGDSCRPFELCLCNVSSLAEVKLPLRRPSEPNRQKRATHTALPSVGCRIQQWLSIVHLGKHIQNHLCHSCHQHLHALTSALYASDACQAVDTMSPLGLSCQPAHLSFKSCTQRIRIAIACVVI